MKTLVALFAVLSLLSGCKDPLGLRGDGPLPFPWMKTGNQFIYDFHPVSDTLTSPSGFRYGDTERALTITVRNESPSFELDHDFAWPQGLPGELFPSTSSIEGFLVEEGFKNRAFRDCSDLLGLSSFRYVRVPASPQLNQEYPQYACGKEVKDILRVEAVNKPIRVKAGMFTTFVLRSQQNGWREYWSGEDGPIKMELYEPDGNLLGYYELASREIATDLK